MTPSVSTLRAHRARLATLTLALLAACALASCGSEPRVLAKVGTRVITADDFLEVARASQAQYPAPPDSAKRMLLEDMIRRSLMLNEAEQSGLSRDSLLGSLRKGAEEDLLLAALTEQLGERDVPVSEAEVETFYAWRKTEHHLEAIHSAHATMASYAATSLAAGEPFSNVAARFNIEGVVPPSGDLGFIQGGALPEPFDTKMRETPTGEIFGPLQVGNDAWFIARVTGRRPADLPPLEMVREQVMQQVRQRKYRAQLQRSIEALRAGYEVRLEPGAAQAMFARAGGTSDSTAPRRSEDTIVLARYRDARGDTVFTMADAMDEIESIAEGPDFSSVPAIQRWIESRVMRRVVLAEARRRHLNEEPVAVRRLDDRIDGSALQMLYDREVSMRVTVSDEDLREEYLARTIGTAAPPFEQAPYNLREQLRSMMLEARREQVLRQFTDSLRRKYPLTIFEEELKRLQWPAPALEAPTQG